MQEVRPRKLYWKFLVLYTIVVIMLKALISTDLSTKYFPDKANTKLKNF